MTLLVAYLAFCGFSGSELVAAECVSTRSETYLKPGTDCGGAVTPILYRDCTNENLDECLASAEPCTLVRMAASAVGDRTQATSPGPIRHLSTASEFTEGSQGASNGVTEPYEPTANDVTVVNHLATDSQGFVVLNRRSDVLERFVGDGFVDFADSPPGMTRPVAAGINGAILACETHSVKIKKPAPTEEPKSFFGGFFRRKRQTLAQPPPCMIFDASGAWRPLEDQPKETIGAGAAVVTVGKLGGQQSVWLIGGENPNYEEGSGMDIHFSKTNGFLSDVKVFRTNAERMRWVSGPKYPHPVIRLGAVAISGHELLACGGDFWDVDLIEGHLYSDKCFLLDTEGYDGWIERPRMPERKGFFVMAALHDGDGDVHVIAASGYVGNVDDFTHSQTVAVLDVRKKLWQRADDLKGGWQLHGVSVDPGGRRLVAIATVPESWFVEEQRTHVVSYNLMTDTWDMLVPNVIDCAEFEQCWVVGVPN